VAEACKESQIAKGSTLPKKIGSWKGSCPRHGEEPGAIELVEVRGIEPLSENIQHNSPTCVADDLKFAVAHAHRPA
jgi:hypothetical protein